MKSASIDRSGRRRGGRPSYIMPMSAAAALAAASVFMTACHCAEKPERADNTGALFGAQSSAGQTKLNTQTTLYFGRNSSDGRGVSEQQWRRFCDEYLTPRFPDGLTIVEGTGQFRSPADHSLTIEDSRFVILLHDNSAAARANVSEVAREYARRFGQESVLRVDQAVTVGFDVAR